VTMVRATFGEPAIPTVAAKFAVAI
jgi:hypothetical protein